MAIAYNTKSWNNKPPVGVQLIRGHPLADRLVGCWLLNEKTGIPVNLVTGKFGVDNGCAWNLTGLTGSGSNSFGLIDSTINVFAVGVGSFIIGQVTATESGTKVLLGRNGGGNSWWMGNVSGKFQLNVGAATVTSATSFNDGLSHSLAATNGASTANVYVDGRFEATGGNGTAGTTTGAVRLFKFGDGSGFNFTGTAGYIHIYDRQLLHDEIMAVHLNPFSMVEPQSPQKRYWYTSVSVPTFTDPPFAATISQPSIHYIHEIVTIT